MVEGFNGNGVRRAEGFVETPVVVDAKAQQGARLGDRRPADQISSVIRVAEPDEVISLCRFEISWQHG